ncbi:MAG TPA: nucleoside transporter C-terminal domain-containing protein [Coleofasciculaceae cyanobacterium]|jgi:CNT family concentrative nucleoside transporter
MSLLNIISFIGIFGLCAIAWLFSENHNPKYFPWRVVIVGIVLQLLLGFSVFMLPATRELLQGLNSLLNVLFDAADAGARFIFGSNLVPLPGQEPLVLSPLAEACAPGSTQVLSGFCGLRLGYIFAFRALPALIFFSGLMALLSSLGIIQIITRLLAKIFYPLMRLSGAEALSGAANIFVGVEAVIVVRQYLAKMTRSELCAVLACCFGTAASSTLAIYGGFLRPVFPNILGHLVSASILAIPACFLLSKILVPETSVPMTADGLPDQPLHADENGGRGARTSIERVGPMEAAIEGAIDGVRMAVAIAGILILILGLVYLINQFFGGLTRLPSPIGDWFKVLTLQNLLGALFLPLTVLTGVSLEWQELWNCSVLIGRRLFETAIPPYQSLGVAAATGALSSRAVVIVSYALSGFAHLAALGIFVGGLVALIPSRRREIGELGWKALLVGTLATYMIACVAGTFDTGNPSILGSPTAQPSVSAPSPASNPITAPEGAPIAPAVP